MKSLVSARHSAHCSRSGNTCPMQQSRYQLTSTIYSQQASSQAACPATHSLPPSLSLSFFHLSLFRVTLRLSSKILRQQHGQFLTPHTPRNEERSGRSGLLVKPPSWANGLLQGLPSTTCRLLSGFHLQQSCCSACLKLACDQCLILLLAFSFSCGSVLLEHQGGNQQ